MNVLAFASKAALIGLLGLITAGSSPLSAAPVQAPSAQASEWEQTLAAANAEGEVIVWTGDTGEDARQHLKDTFEQAFPGIRVNLFQATTSTERDSRLLQELEAGVARVDVMVGGSAGANSRLKPAGALQDVRPFMIRQDVWDPSNWLGGALYWVDEEQQYIIMGDSFLTPALAANQSVNATDLQTWWDLLDPKWHGQIVMTDPRQSGAGFARGNFFYHTPELGPEYMRRFFSETGVVFNQDERQNLDWVISGRFLLTISPNPFMIEDARQVGLEFGLIPTLKVNDSKVTDFVSGSQGIAMIPNINPLPHPNAAKVFYNWFYSKDGMQGLVDVRLRPTRRTDVDMSKLPDYVVPKPGVDYLNLNSPIVTADSTVAAMREQVNRWYPN